MKSIRQLQEAKNQLSLAVEDALPKSPQTITRQGKPAVAVVSVEEFQRQRQAEGPSGAIRSAQRIRYRPRAHP